MQEEGLWPSELLHLAAPVCETRLVGTTRPSFVEGIPWASVGGVRGLRRPAHRKPHRHSHCQENKKTANEKQSIAKTNESEMWFMKTKRFQVCASV